MSSTRPLTLTLRYVTLRRVAQRGWYARGKLTPLYVQFGGRDTLAAKSGVSPQTLSAINSGARRMADDVYERLVGVGVSPVALGRPDGRDAGDGEAAAMIRRVEGRVTSLDERLATLEHQVADLRRGGAG